MLRSELETAPAMRSRCLRLFLRHTPVMVGVETIEHARAHRREFSARDLPVIIRIRIWPITTVAALTAMFTVRALGPLRPLARADHAVAVRIEPRELLQRTRQEFIARDVAIIVHVGAR